jgi:hypothetical protein
MKKDTLIGHKEVVIVCEESGLVSFSYNALLTTLDVNIIAKPMLKEKELVKAKGVEYWQLEECLWDSFIDTIRYLQHDDNDKQPNTITKEQL